jgi:hypothetical protein
MKKYNDDPEKQSYVISGKMRNHYKNDKKKLAIIKDEEFE